MDAVPFSDPAVIRVAEAVKHDDADAVRAAVAGGANPNAQGEEGLNLLQFAILNAQPHSLKALLQAGADPNRPGIGGATALHTAAIVDDPQYLELLLEFRGDPNVEHAITAETPLAQATGPRTDAQFRLLLQAGADPNKADRTGNTPLHRAGMINAGAHVLALLHAGADARLRNAQQASFQTYYFRTDANVLNAQARAQREAVVQWLREHDVALEAVVD